MICINYIIMSCKRILLNQLLHIELHNFKGICPIVYQINKTQYTAPIANYHIDNENNLVDINTNSKVALYNIYFINGFNKHVSLLSHIKNKYNCNSTSCYVDDINKCKNCIHYKSD